MDSSTNVIDPADNPVPSQRTANSFSEACYTFTEKVAIFTDSIHFLSKFSDTLQIEFGEGYLKLEAITSSKSAYGSATFRESCFSDWSLGDLGVNQDRKVQLSAKHLMIAIRGVNKQHQFSLSFGGEYCDRTTICYKNYEEITRTFQLACRDVPMTFEQLDYDKETFTNYISIATNTFDKFFHQLSDDDELRFRLEEDRLFVEKFIQGPNKGKVPYVCFTVPRGKFVDYVVVKPMSFIVSYREMKAAFKLVSSYAHIAQLYLDPDGKPLLMTFDDDEQDLTCQAIISVADPVTLAESQMTITQVDQSNVNNQENSNIISLSLRNRTDDQIENSPENPVIYTPQKGQEDPNSSRRFSFDEPPPVASPVPLQSTQAITQNRNQLSSQSQRIPVHCQRSPSTPVQERLCEEDPTDLPIQGEPPAHTPPKRRKLDENSNLHLVLKQLGLLDILDTPSPPVLEIEMPEPKGQIIVEQTQFAN